MKLLGIDYGLKRVGISLSDDGGTLAFPNSVLENKNLSDQILKICDDNNVEKIIIGESKDYSQKDNPIMVQVKSFIEELKQKTNLEIVLHPEFMTSMQAQKEIGEKGKMVDAQAAAIMLQSYIDLR